MITNLRKAILYIICSEVSCQLVFQQHNCLNWLRSAWNNFVVMVLCKIIPWSTKIVRALNKLTKSNGDKDKKVSANILQYLYFAIKLECRCTSNGVNLYHNGIYDNTPFVIYYSIRFLKVFTVCQSAPYLQIWS